MNQEWVRVEGVVQLDGSLLLQDKITLPPGRVAVTVTPMIDPKETEVCLVLEGIWDNQRKRGHVPRSKEEIDRELAHFREEDEARMQALEQLQIESARLREERFSKESR